MKVKSIQRPGTEVIRTKTQPSRQTREITKNHKHLYDNACVQGSTNGTNIVQGSTNGTIGNTIGTNGNANGTIDHWLPMVPLVKLHMIPLGEPRTEPM